MQNNEEAPAPIFRPWEHNNSNASLAAPQLPQHYFRFPWENNDVNVTLAVPQPPEHNFRFPWEHNDNNAPLAAPQPPARAENIRINLPARSPALPTLEMPSGSQPLPTHSMLYEEVQLYPGLPVNPFLEHHQHNAAHNPNHFEEFDHASNEEDTGHTFMPFVPCDHHAKLFTPQEYRRIMNFAKLSHENKIPYMYIPEGVPPPMAMHPFGFNNNLPTAD